MSETSIPEGIWCLHGYSKLWDLSPGECILYDLSNLSGLEVKRESPAAWLARFDRIERPSPDVLTLYERGGITQYTLLRQDELPLQCHRGGTPKSRNPEFNFDVFWHYFDEDYAFFDLRGVDWNHVYDSYRSQISAETTDAQLLEIFTGILALLGDLHVSLKAGTQVIESARPHALLAQWHKEFGLGDEDALYHVGGNKLRQVIQQDFLREGSQEATAGLLVWGEVVPRIGYLNILAMEGFAGPDADLTEELRVLNTALDQVMADFQAMDAVILDLRFNPGGHDAASLAIAGRFIDRQQLAFSKKARLDDTFTEIQNIYVQPQGAFQFTGPIALLTSESTVSAAEIFALTTMGFPHVTRMGGSTQGVLSDVLDKQLPNGWQLGISNEVYIASDGCLYEGTGIPVHIEVPVFFDDFFYGGLKSTVLRATALLQDKLVTLGKLARADLEPFLEEMRLASNLPGLAACIVRGDQLVWSQGFGWANIEQHISMTSDTIMNIGSISKTITATAVMQLWEQALFRLDDDINDYLPLPVRNPSYPDTPITFRQLLTHTSSIIDSPAYEESYACGDPTVPLEEWIQSYFNPGGTFFDTNRNWGTWQPGNRFCYANTPFGLLGYLVELLAGKAFGEYCHTHIFAPLGMTNTSFYLADLDTSKHAVPYTYSAWGQLRGRLLSTEHDRHVREGYLPNCLYSFPNIPDGLVRTSVRQLACFLIAYLNGGTYMGQRVLRQDTIQQMLTRQLDPSFVLDEGRGMGLTWAQFETTEGDWLWGHSGSDPGISTLLLFHPNRRIGVIVFTNTSDGLLLRTIADRLLLEAETL